MKKATMKDIARLANVSVATVSYVLNNVKNQTIPDPTRQSILQIAKELNYVPNLAARSLVVQRTGMVGILINKSPRLPFWKRQSYMTLVDSLESKLTESGYHTLLISLDPQNPAMDVIRERKLDAVFVVDVMEKMFYRISANFVDGVPLILIDSLIDDRMFNQVNYNYPLALKSAVSAADAPSCLVMESFHNQALTTWITDSSGLSKENIYIAADPAGAPGTLEDFLQQNRGKHVIVMNEFLAKSVEHTGLASSITALCTCGIPEIVDSGTRVIRFQNNRAETAFELMMSLKHIQEDPRILAGNQFLVEVLP
ncbi:LacI family DNA-binding transcriptional regulator [Paenibacillus tianjinensis]|uniref:LacI family DNA-binding transcriptional regulator n=1 Tax=Paenibacillus tianjinensis TaxID=2810347 RepID=A0ABX7L6D0_9BACL|nr:LacI family DNA-binding transcriptional regulator [Paenibacillus tianjinensis]QSF42499.1 LacI family DNA-binding transcriptional regulator [Paenibacillus tianjinensis]